MTFTGAEFKTWMVGAVLGGLVFLHESEHKD